MGPSIHVSDLLLKDFINWGYLVDILFFDNFSQFCNLFSLALRLFVCFAALLLSDFVFASLLFSCSASFNSFGVGKNFFLVSLLSRDHVVTNHRGRVTAVGLHLYNEL